MKGMLCVSLMAFLSLQASVAFGQTLNTTEPTEDSRIAVLNAQDPATLVSEAVYDKGRWPRMLESNISWKMRIWRTIDTRDGANDPLNCIGDDKSNLAAVLIRGALEGKYKVYPHSDERFTKELPVDAVKRTLLNDSTKPDLPFDASLITKYRLKEDWLYLTTEKKLVCRIIGIAPVREVIAADGVMTEQVMFWLYYPGMRNYLVAQRITNAASGKAQNLDELFEKREYSGQIQNTRTPPKLTAAERERMLRVEAMMEAERKRRGGDW